MDETILKFFKKNSISIGDIKYLTREESKTCIALESGRVVRTFITVKDFFIVLAPYGFISINKGTVVSKKHIDRIEGCTYYMSDGRILKGRKRTVSAHKHLSQTLRENAVSSIGFSEDIRSRFSVLDNMPVAFCVIELLFNDSGHGVDFVFRYCNKEMEHVEGKTMDEMLNRSFFKVFPNADKKWLVAYTDVAINGKARYFRDYSPEIGQELYISCFQPMEGYCACLLTPVEQMQEAPPAIL